MPTMTLDMPAEVFSSIRRSPEEFLKEMRQAAAMYWYERGEISQEKAGQIAGLDRTDFLDLLARNHVNVFAVDLEALKQEITGE